MPQKQVALWDFESVEKDAINDSTRAVSTRIYDFYFHMTGNAPLVINTAREVAERSGIIENRIGVPIKNLNLLAP
jgi:hypothetical protein